MTEFILQADGVAKDYVAARDFLGRPTRRCLLYTSDAADE